MAMTTHVGSFEHHYDPDAESQRFVLTIDAPTAVVAGLLLLLAVRFFHRVRRH